jgi:hypothetical protein
MDGYGMNGGVSSVQAGMLKSKMRWWKYAYTGLRYRYFGFGPYIALPIQYISGLIAIFQVKISLGISQQIAW